MILYWNHPCFHTHEAILITDESQSVFSLGAASCSSSNLTKIDSLSAEHETKTMRGPIMNALKLSRITGCPSRLVYPVKSATESFALLLSALAVRDKRSNFEIFPEKSQQSE
jgi:hypothetical protein